MSAAIPDHVTLPVAEIRRLLAIPQTMKPCPTCARPMRQHVKLSEGWWECVNGNCPDVKRWVADYVRVTGELP